jgi:hypothetical protein
MPSTLRPGSVLRCMRSRAGACSAICIVSLCRDVSIPLRAHRRLYSLFRRRHHGLFAFLLEELGRNLSKLFRHTLADVLPTEGELGAHLVYGWVGSRRDLWVICG